jgi:RNA polymerase sigma factor (sigma-70 family)
MTISPQRWEDVKQRVGGQLLAFLKRYVGDTEAEDILQQTYTAILARLARPGPELQLATNDDFKKFAFRVARNNANSYFRSKEVRREQPFPETEDGRTMEPPNRTPCPDESLKLERIKALRDCMRKLDQEKKYTIFLWEVLAGKDYQAIAKQFKVSINTVGSTLSAGRKKLRTCIDSKSDLAG